MSEEQSLTDIVGYLEHRSGTIAPDERESLDLAIECLKETFSVKPDSKPQDLSAIYERGVKGNSNPEETKPETQSSEAASESVEVSDEAKAEGDALKSKGNKLMAARDFSGAADAYTEAIAKDPTNPMFYSNRAAAYSHLSLHAKAVQDARRATESNPSYSKAWSRLGLALWAEGDIKGSSDAYESGSKAEGDHPTDAMRRDYENVKKRYDEEVAKNPSKFADSLSKSDSTTSDNECADTDADAGAGAGGFDFSQLSGLMNNPQIQQMAKSLMSDPGALGNLMNSPMAQQMKNQFSNGQMPSMNDIGNMMNNPAIQDMMKNLKK